MCTDPLKSAFAALPAGTSAGAAAQARDGDILPVTDGATVSAQALAPCVAEAMGRLKGYQERHIVGGAVQQTSHVNVQPLKVDMVLASPQPNGLEEVIMLEGFVFAKVNGKWLEVTEDAPDRSLRALLNLPQSFQTQFNPRLRTAGTSEQIHYTVTGTARLQNQPVLVLDAQIGTGASAYTSRYFLTADYLLLRSDVTRAASSDGSGAASVTTSELTAIDEPQDIANPFLAQTADR